MIVGSPAHLGSGLIESERAMVYGRNVWRTTAGASGRHPSHQDVAAPTAGAYPSWWVQRHWGRHTSWYAG